MTKEEFCRLYTEHHGDGIDAIGQLVQHTFTGEELYEFCEYLLKNASSWIEYDFFNSEKRPKKYGKYFVHRKDGKIHWETWNGSGWAYNGGMITHWQEIKLPPKSGS